MYFGERERKRESEWRGGAEGEEVGERESQADSPLSMESDVGLNITTPRS